MSQLVIHQPCNHHSKIFRDYNVFFDDIIDALQKKHSVVVDRYRKMANHGPSICELDLLENTSIPLLECEMIIENITKKEIYIFSVADDLTSAVLDLQSNDLVKKIFVSQFIRDKINHHVSPDNQFKYFPWIYFPSNDQDFDFYHKLRTFIPEKIDKMYFRGSMSYRPMINYIDKDFFWGGDSIGGFNNYVKELINYKVAISVAGRGEICYRDIECMSMGIPIIRFEYLSEFYSPLLPNVHYISVDRPDDLKSWSKLDREGNEYHAKLITDRFLEIKDDEQFLSMISTNAKKYYDEYLSKESRIKLTLNIINL